jgi:hypothetical protein
VLGFIVGAEISIAIVAWQSGRLWPITMIVGTIVAAIFVPLAGVPLYRILRARHALRIYWAVAIGGALVALQDVVFAILSSGGFENLSIGGKTLVSHGRFTAEGLRDYFVERPIMFFALGAVSGLAGWVIAVGFCYEPPRKSVPEPISAP